jgi:hypothetical protein
MLKSKFIKISEDPEFYDNEFLNYYDGNDSKANKYLIQYLELFFEKLNMIQTTAEGIIAWRAINSPSIKQINLTNIGASWSYHKKSAHTWYGGEGDKFIIQGIIPYESIDFETTLRQNLVNPDEDEIRLEADSLVLIEKIFDENFQLLQEFSQGLQSSSGQIGSVGDWTSK